MDKKMNIALVAKVKQGDIYAAMQKRGWNVRTAAQFIGIPVPKLYRIVNLQTAIPQLTVEQEVKLTELTGKTLEEMFPSGFRPEEFLNGKRQIVAFRDCDPSELAASGMRCLPVPLSAGNEELLLKIAEHLHLLRQSEREVLYSRYIENKTLDEVAEERGVTRERVRQIQLNAEMRLRSYVGARGGGGST